ncbi:MAG: hypothetical protein LBV32_06410 [Tannerellaceae bacterium]|jgi:rRNA-processing protein FCF1|nr:hypothetical protein [Tannerellaceae bacterium]
MVLFDTNAVLRYILQDNADMADKVEAQLQENTCYVRERGYSVFTFDKQLNKRLK